MNTALRQGVIWGLAIATLLLSVFQLHNDDAGFHVANGQWILDQGTIPLHNPFSYANDGAVWVQHQWLSATWMALIAGNWGAKGLILWKASLVFLTFLLLMSGCKRLPLAWLTGLGMLTIGASAYRFVERPYLITMLLMGLTGIVLTRWREQPEDKRMLLVGLVATVLSFHFHAGGLYCLLLWGALAADGLITDITSHSPKSWSRSKTVLPWLAALVALTGFTLLALAPSGLQVLLLPFGFSHHEYWNQHLGEFRPLPIHMDAWPQWCLIVVASFTGLWSLRTRQFFQGLVLLGFSFLAIKHARMIYPLGVALLAMAGSLTLPSPRGKPWVWVFLAVGITSMASGSWGHMNRVEMGLGEDGFDRRKHPIELMNLAKELPGETFVSDGLAGTWLWQVYDGSIENPEDQKRVLIHNCLECYEEDTYKDEYQWIRYGNEGWEQKVDALNIRSFLLKHTTPGARKMQQGKPNIRHHLFQSDRWHLVEFNDVASLYVRGDALPGGIHSLDGGKQPFPVDPDSWRPRKSDTPWPRLKESLEKHSTNHPKEIRSLMILGQLAMQIGDIPTLAEATKEVLGRRPDGPEAQSLRLMLTRATGK